MLFQWSNVIIGFDDPEISTSNEQRGQVFMDLAMYALKLYAARKENPGDDLITMLVNTEVNGETMSVPDFLSAFILLVVAGNETTRNSISGGTLALSQFPAERQKLVDDPSLIGSAVDEIIRWVHPVIYMRRTAMADYTLRGVTIKKGDKVALWYMSGNRDEEKWADPFTFNVTPQRTAPSIVRLRPAPVHRLASGRDTADGAARRDARTLSGHRSDRRHHADADELPQQHKDDAGSPPAASRSLTPGSGGSRDIVSLPTGALSTVDHVVPARIDPESE